MNGFIFDWSFSLSPVAPLAVIAVLGGIGLLLVLGGLLARSRGALLRLSMLTLLVLTLLNPSVRREERDQLADIAVVVIDDSQSQRLGDRQARTKAAADMLAQDLKTVPALDVRTVTVRSGLSSAETGTQLFNGLNGALADVPPDRFAGAIMVTDGQVHDVPKSLAEMGYQGPVHALITGERGERDRRIVVEQAPRFGIVGERQIVKFRVEQTGRDIPATGDVDIAVTVNGETMEGLTIPVGQTFELPITIKRGGPTLTELTAAPLEDELSLQNNSAIVETKGVRDRLRVLLVSGEPHPGERTWRNLLKADASVDLVHFTILRPPEKQDGTPIRELSLIAFPTRELFSEKLDQFDLIIFDRYQRRGVLPAIYISNVVNYVENGGAVLLAAGPDFASPLSLYRSPLSTVLPSAPTGGMTVEPFKPEITEQGKRHPVTRDLPGSEQSPPSWGRWFRLIDVDQMAGDAVMSGPDNKPLMILSRHNEGRVAQLLSDHAWLWARGYDGGGPQSELLRRLAHWLMKEPDLEEEALIGRHDGSRLVIERRTMADTAADVTVAKPSGDENVVKLTETEPGIWRGEVTVDEVGLHRLTDGKISSVAAVGSPDPKEAEEVAATDAKLQPITDATGGGIYWLADRTGSPTSAEIPRLRKVAAGRVMAGSGWLGLKDNGAYRIRDVVDVPLFSTLAALALLLGLMGLTWYREGR
ncbi:hypothetical protein FHS85_003386 [Rhodoligotrophos appendicifer]|uniref:hypothetical protein n=1 Tax=Rhodoligotrophos appendicifer TaxID=987056 RepID=UPI001185C39C|nr:hypothetical protein [Rhodoligotrophos appendicifer]